MKCHHNKAKALHVAFEVRFIVSTGGKGGGMPGKRGKVKFSEVTSREVK